MRKSAQISGFALVKKVASPWKTEKKKNSGLFALKRSSKRCGKILNWCQDTQLLAIFGFQKIVLHTKIINEMWTTKN